MHYLWIWILAILLFGIAEIFTTELVSVWFAAGALGAFCTGLFDVTFITEVLAFFSVAFICIWFVRPRLVRRFKAALPVPDLDKVLGKTITLTQTVNNQKLTGTATFERIEWRVKSYDNSILQAGEQVEVIAIEGTRLVVKKQQGGAV